MFTDSAKWKKPVKDKFSLSLLQYPIAEFNYQMIKLKSIPAEEFEKKIHENPLAAAYLPLTDYPKEERPMIKAKALNGVVRVSGRPKRAVLVSLIDQSLCLDDEEERQFKELIQDNPMFQEVKMLQAVEEVFIEKGREIGVGIGREIGVGIGRKEALEETAIHLLRSGWLKKEQISEITKLDKAKLDELEKALKNE